MADENPFQSPQTESEPANEIEHRWRPEWGETIVAWVVSLPSFLLVLAIGSAVSGVARARPGRGVGFLFSGEAFAALYFIGSVALIGFYAAWRQYRLDSRRVAFLGVFIATICGSLLLLAHIQMYAAQAGGSIPEDDWVQLATNPIAIFSPFAIFASLLAYLSRRDRRRAEARNTGKRIACETRE